MPWSPRNSAGSNEALQQAPEAILRHETVGAEIGEGEQAAGLLPPGLHAGHVHLQIGAVPDEPFQPLLEGGQPLEHLRFEDGDGEQGNQPHHRADLERQPLPVGQMEHVVKEAVPVVPEMVAALAAGGIHGRGDVEEMLEELRRHFLVDGILLRQLQGDREHSEAEHVHPAGAIGLLDEATGGQGALRSNTPMLSRPRKPPWKMLLPSASLRFTHQVKLSSSFWNTRSRKGRSPRPLACFSRLYTCQVAQACTGGLTSPKAHS